MAKSERYFLGLDFLVTLVLHIFFGYVMGIIHRILKRSWLWAIVDIVLGFGFVFWIVDLVSLLLNKDIKWLI